MKLSLIFYFLIAAPNISYALEALTAGVGISEQNKDTLWDTSVPYAVARQGQRQVDDSKVVTGFVELGSSIWSVSTGIRLIETNVSDRFVKGSWRLGVSNPCEGGKCATPWWAGRWGADEVIEKELIDQYTPSDFSWEATLNTDVASMGCMQSSPLRYGDLNTDGKKELVVLRPNGYSVDFIVFSPELKKTVFSSKLDYNDVISHADLVADKLRAEHLPLKPEKYFQFWSRSGSDEMRVGAMMQGYRGFAKLYSGEFSGAGNRDLLVWRKLYSSRLLSDSVKGFQKISDTYVHYKAVNGDYKKQITDSATIKSWLAAQLLTWQKGFPSKSECSGQVGQLIPEMHDPLLNDPDVLK